MTKENKENIIRFTPKIKHGLSTNDVELRKVNGLTNNTKSKTSKSYGRIIIENTFTFFSCVLFIIALLLIICDLGWIPGVGKDAMGNLTYPFGPTKFLFLVPLIINIIIGTVQECRSKAVLEKLSFVNKQKYKAIRNNEEIYLTTDEIVADDIIYLESGQQIPADMIILNGNVDVNESLLTGESEDVKKENGDKLYSGSFISSGSCIATADKVGKDTYVMSIQSKVKEITKNKSQLMRNIYSIIKVMTIILFILVISSIISEVIKNSANLSEHITDIIGSVSAVAIGCIPTGLVLITSITLAVSVIYLAKKKILIQELYSLENLSRIDTICFDKTGTLTDGSMSVDSYLIINKKSDFKGFIGTFLGAMTDHNQTMLALLKKFKQNQKYTVEAIEPFSSAKKFSAVYLKDSKIVLKLGAPEYILTGEDLDYIKIVDKKASEGYRVLAFTADDSLIALLYLTDNIRNSAVKTIKYFNENGVDVKIISGDNQLTVSNIAKKCGVRNADRCINMQHVELEEIPNIVDDFTVFGRINPEQKEAVVKALQEKKHKVGMTGDGVNDALALKAADASITFQTATDAAKGISDVVLMDDSFDHVTDVVGQGRRVVNNIQRSAVLFLAKTFYIIFMVLFSFFFPKGLAFFNIENLFILEIAVIGISGFLLSMENTKKPITEGFKKSVYPRAITSGLLMAIGALTTNILALTTGLPTEMTTTLTATIVTIGSLFVLLMICIPMTTYKGIVVAIASIVSITMMLAYPNIFLLADTAPEGVPMIEYFINVLSHPFDFSKTFELFTSGMWWCLGVFSLLAVPIYIGLMAFIQYLLNKSYTSKLLKKYIKYDEDED